MKKVAIINYGAGNLASLINAVDYLGYNTVVLDRPKKNYDFSHIILPKILFSTIFLETFKNNIKFID